MSLCGWPLLLLLQLQRRGVDAVADTGRRGPVGEEVAEMAAAARAHDLGANHPVGRVRLLVDRIARGGRVERRPSAAGVVLRVRAEQLGAATGADVPSV